MTEQIGNYIVVGYTVLMTELGVCLAIAQVVA